MVAAILFVGFPQLGGHEADVLRRYERVAEFAGVKKVAS
jgi:hypothetical protein